MSATTCIELFTELHGLLVEQDNRKHYHVEGILKALHGLDPDATDQEIQAAFKGWAAKKIEEVLTTGALTYIDELKQRAAR